MCVIAYGTARALRPHVRDMMEANPHGAGMAWLSRGRLHYVKGLTKAADALRILRQPQCGRPATILFHSRIATSGGISPELCHPFPVELGAPVAVEGSSGMLLAHNGIWGGWTQHLPALPSNGHPWSDTRAAAHLLASGGLTLAELETVGGAWCIFTPEAFKMYGNGWSNLNGLLVSNRLFLRRWRKAWRSAGASCYYSEGYSLPPRRPDPIIQTWDDDGGFHPDYWDGYCSDASDAPATSPIWTAPPPFDEKRRDAIIEAWRQREEKRIAERDRPPLALLRRVGL